MSIEMLSAGDAIARIGSCTASGGQVLGVDGFQIIPKGYIGRLDLILDLSVRPITPEAAVAEAIAFVPAHCADDIMFEVVADWPGEVL
ncbi:hypothetical protein ACG3SL_02350 [Sphingomonas sp. CJ20]